MRSQFFKIKLRLFSFVRDAFAAFLLLAFLSEALLTGVSSMSASNAMPCCTRGGSHSSMSDCLGGVCHLKSKKRKKRFAASLPNEPLCGIKKERVPPSKSTSELFQQFFLINAQYQRDELMVDSSLDQSRKESSNSDGVSIRAFTRSCKSECGNGAFGWTGQNGKGNKALIAHAQRPRPPTATKTLLIEYLLAGKSKSATLSIRPRAPPPAFS